MAFRFIPLRLVAALITGLAFIVALSSAGVAQPPVLDQTRNWSQDYELDQEFQSSPGQFAPLVRGQHPGYDDAAEVEGGPEHIRDNAFLVEEAFNQEAGEVQHIFNWVLFWDRVPGGHTRDFINTYTMEIPLGSQRHQFSFTTQFLTAFEHLNGIPPTQQADVGDTFLNYRYQLLSNDDFLWCAPRATLILPTANEQFGFGSGELGYQCNLPISRYGDSFDFHFNIGATYTPGVEVPLPGGFLSPTLGLSGYNLGASTFWKPEVYLHFFVEWLMLWNDEILDTGEENVINQVLVNPGMRYAVCQFDEVEWVLGVSVPIGLTRDTPDIGVFAYMSIEHLFNKK